MIRARQLTLARREKQTPAGRQPFWLRAKLRIPMMAMAGIPLALAFLAAAPHVGAAPPGQTTASASSLGLVLATAGLIVWAIVAKAPLEQPANPGYAPNPAKAPWYFLGLQEMLVYFDPWMAGVVYPGLIIVGLMLMPIMDTNPRGNGYYTLKERPFAIVTWLFGFLILWVVLIFFGTFLRGPNWSFFGPYEYWDPHRPAALTNINLSEIFWINWLGSGLPSRETHGEYYYLLREAPGIIALLGYFILTPWILKETVFKKLHAEMGGARYAVMMILFTWLALVPLKMLLRWTLNLKYIVAITEWFFNV